MNSTLFCFLQPALFIKLLAFVIAISHKILTQFWFCVMSFKYINLLILRTYFLLSNLYNFKGNSESDDGICDIYTAVTAQICFTNHFYNISGTDNVRPLPKYPIHAVEFAIFATLLIILLTVENTCARSVTIFTTHKRQLSRQIMFAYIRRVC